MNKILSLFLSMLMLSLLPAVSFAKSASSKEELIQDYRAKGYDAQEKGDINKALEYYTKATSLGLEDPQAYNDLGVLYEQMGWEQKAEESYVQALQVDSSYMPPYLNLAYLYLNRGQSNLAAELFMQRYELGRPGEKWTEKAKEELLKISPQYADKIIAHEAEVFQQELVDKKREVFYEKVNASKEFYKKGLDLYTIGAFQQAIVEYDRALNLTPQNPKVIDARKQAVIAIAKKNIQDRSTEAIQLLEQGDSTSAKNEIKKALTTIP